MARNTPFRAIPGGGQKHGKEGCWILYQNDEQQ
jgi:hypothetical protein